MPEAKIIKFSELSKFTPKQWEACQQSETHKYLLYGGSMGAGKSYWLRWMAIYWLLTFAAETKIPGIRAGLFCEDYTSLNDRHISKIKTEFPAALGTYNEQRHEFQLHARFGGGILAFRNLDDPSKYLSSEFAWIGVDELVKNPKSSFDVLRTRLRWPGITNPRFNAATNPGEGWVKQYFIERNFPSTEGESEQFAYVGALPKDNPYLPPEYFKNLESLPEAQRKAFLEGDWSAFERNMDDEGFIPLLSSSEIANAFIEEPAHVGDEVITIDPAAGGDNTSVIIKSEICMQILFNQKTKDPLSVIPVVLGFLKSFSRVKMIIVGKTGVGEGVYARFKELERTLGGVRVRGMAEAESPSNKQMFDNLKGELYWDLRAWILRGGKLVEDEGWNEFSTIKYKPTSDGRVHIQSKEERRRHGFKSPNCVEAAMIAMSAPKRLGQVVQGERRDIVTELWRS